MHVEYVLSLGSNRHQQQQDDSSYEQAPNNFSRSSFSLLKASPIHGLSNVWRTGPKDRFQQGTSNNRMILLMSRPQIISAAPVSHCSRPHRSMDCQTCEGQDRRIAFNRVLAATTIWFFQVNNIPLIFVAPLKKRSCRKKKKRERDVVRKNKSIEQWA